MISHLRIQGLALIDELSIDFSEGFNVLTGETGAGKSILIRALNFLIGAKASSEQIRKGFESASVEAQFRLPRKHPATERLGLIGVLAQDEGGFLEITIRRNLLPNGRSQAWINDQSVTLGSLKSVGEVLVDVFGQHENQRLLNKNCHLDYVDRFLNDKPTLEKYRKSYDEARASLKQLAQILHQLKNLSDDRDYLTFRLEELQKFAPTQEDYEKIKNLTESGSELIRAKETYGKMLAILECEGVRTVPERLWEVQKMLQAEQMEELQNEAAELAAKAESLHYEISKHAETGEVDENEIQEAQERVFGYQTLFRKHHVRDIEGLLSALDALALAAQSGEQLEAQIEKILSQLEKQTKELSALSSKISKMRLEASNRMKKSVESELRELSMPGARFGVNWKAFEAKKLEIEGSDLPESLTKKWEATEEVLSTLHATGGEECEFLLGANVGEELFSLSKIASGGELSRTMLALKKALSVDAETCVLVFDEIDTGISGRVADVVGRKLRELARDFQVICISHLPQVAVYADTHFLVEKARSKGSETRTSTSLIRLTSEESEQEIARLLSGESVTKMSLENAKALVEKAKGPATKTKNSVAPKSKKTKTTKRIEKTL